ncbi:MAG: CpsD/CapB family tyrosine-protein kinase, partial [Clostridia bacterium]|nr:CpsD/CapB family tyrosine-protein kinase [Clostridia bacterium]
NKKIPFAVVESYKAIRTNLSFLLASAKSNVVVITSPNSGEGKSTTAANMAIAFSQLGERVLLIDADMRRASLHKKLKTDNGDGLSNILAGMAKIDDCIKQVNENFYFLPSGRIPPNPSELLGSSEFEALIKKVSPAYGCIIIDTPPINIVSDTLVVAPHTAGIVMVVRDGITQNDDIKHVIDSAKFANIKILGAVINGIKQSAVGSYRSGSRYYKKRSYF